MKHFISLLITVAFLTSYGQELALNSDLEIDKIYIEVDQSAEYPGGIFKMYDYIMADLKYPELARENQIKGRLFIAFVVEKDGSISNLEVLKSLGYGCDEEAIRLFKEMPKWSPGLIDGKPVRQKFVQPILFKPD